MKIIAQVSYLTDAGQMFYGEPRTLSLRADAAPASPPGNVKPPVVAARPSGPARGDDLTKLLADLKAKDEPTRQRAASTLQQAPPRQRRPEVRRALQELLAAKDPSTRIAGVLALVACDPKGAAPQVVKLIADPAARVRQEVFKVLKELKDARVAEAVAARLPMEPQAVCDVLRALGPGAEKAVLPYLANKYAGNTRVSAFGVIREIGTAASLPALTAVQGGDQVHVVGVLQALHDRLPLIEEEWPQAMDDLKSYDAGRRTQAARRIAVTPPIKERRAEMVLRLEWSLNDLSADVRVAAIKGLARWGGKDAIPILVERLEKGEGSLHQPAIELLAELKSEDGIAAIARRLPDFWDRTHALRALMALEPRIVERAILPLLADPNASIRCEVIRVLTEVGGWDSVVPLEKLAAEKNVFYSGPAKQALEAIKDRAESGADNFVSRFTDAAWSYFAAALNEWSHSFERGKK